MVGKRQLAMGASVIENAVHSAANIERNILVATAVVHALSVLILQLEGAAAQIHLCKSLACSAETLVGLTLERERYGIVLALALYQRQRKGIVSRRREMVVGTQSHALALRSSVALGIYSDVYRALRLWKQIAPVFEHGLATINLGIPSALAHDAEHIAVFFNA